MSTILVTGGAGFVGSHIVDQLLECGHEVRVVDALDPAAHGERPGYLRESARVVVADLCDVAAWEDLIDGVDAVCHQAAKVGVGRDFSDAPDYVSANDGGTAALLAALHARRFSGRLVLAGSMVVYGEGRYDCDAHATVRPSPRRREDLAAGRFEPPCPTCGRPLRPGLVTEDAPTNPRTVYAVTKLAQEHLTAIYARESGAALTVLRYHNVYGPRMPRDTPYAGVASLFRSALAAGRAPEVFEDGGQLRDFVHVHDVARANLLALTAPEPAPGTFNIASGDPRTIGDLATALAQAAGVPAPVPSGAYRLGDVRHVLASPERARARLGFVAAVPFAEGVREFLDAPLRAPALAG